MNARVRVPRGSGRGRGSPRGRARGRCPRRHRPVLRRRADQRELLPGPGPRARPEGADHPRDPRLGRRARQGREQRHAGALRPGRPRAAAPRGLQRPDVGLARLRRVGRHGRGRLQGLRGPRRVGPAGLARHPARAAARRRRRSARRHDGRVLRGRDRARRRRHRPPHRRHRAVDRLALAAHRAVPRRPRQGRLGGGARRASGIPTATALGVISPGGRADGNRRPAHHLRARRGARHRPPVRRGPRLVREPRPRRRARLADPRADPARAGHGRHPLHAQRGDPQLRAAEGQRRARAHAVVLRRARRVPDAGRQQPRRGARRRLAAALADGRPRRRRRSDLRVAGRRRPVAQRARLAAGAGPGHDRARARAR